MIVNFVLITGKGDTQIKISGEKSWYRQ